MHIIQSIMSIRTSRMKRMPCELTAGSEKGSALIITLLLISIMVALVVDFVYDVYIDSASLSNWGNAQKASLVAKSGQTLSTLYLQEIKKSPFSYEPEIVLPVEHDFGAGTSLVVEIRDENSKFNINSIIRPNTLTNEPELASLKRLLESLNINPDIALVIADWIDPDSEPRLTTSEDEAKNTYLWSVDELKSIKGVDVIFNKIEPYVTVYSSAGSFSNLNLININTAPRPVLLSLDPGMTDTLAQNIIDDRERFPFESTTAVKDVPGMETIGPRLVGKKISVKSANYRITAKASANGITRIVESVIDTSMNVLFWREG